MPIPQNPRFGDLLRRLLITKEYPQAQVLDDWFPIVDMLKDKPEIYRLRGEKLFFGGGRGLGAVGAAGRVWLMNKKAGQLTMVEALFVSNNVAGNVFIDLTTIGLPADGAGGQSVIHGMDARDGIGTPGTTPVVGTTVANDNAAAPQGVPLGFMTFAPIWYPLHYVLKPNYALVVNSGLVGAGNDILVAFMGYERAAEPNELS